MAVFSLIALMLSMPGQLAAGQGAPAPAVTVDLAQLYAAGRAYEQFFAAVERRAELWKSNTADAEVDRDAVARARALEGTWRLLAVAIDSCSDSVNTIPYIAKLADEVETLDLRIVTPTEGRAVMEAHRTPDGRAATPTVILLDESGKLAGCWVERPATLQSWMLDEGAKLAQNDAFTHKMAWYAKDKGRETVREIVEMLEAAGAGRVSCGASR